jgi:hypothetical protein
MIVEFVSKKVIYEDIKTERDLPILDKVKYLHYEYSGGYDYFVKFIPSIQKVQDKNVFILNFIFMGDKKINKGRLSLSPFDRFPDIVYKEEKNEFDYVGQRNPTDLQTTYLDIIANYWLLKKRVGDCFFSEITEEQFNEEKDKFFVL